MLEMTALYSSHIQQMCTNTVILNNLIYWTPGSMANRFQILGDWVVQFNSQTSGTYRAVAWGTATRSSQYKVDKENGLSACKANGFKIN